MQETRQNKIARLLQKEGFLGFEIEELSYLFLDALLVVVECLVVHLAMLKPIP